MQEPEIALLFFEGRPHSDATLNRLRDVLRAEGLCEAQIQLVEIEDPDKALKLKFLGSPTVRINGEDVDPERNRSDFGLMCRTYRGPDGQTMGGAPDRDARDRARQALLAR